MRTLLLTALMGLCLAGCSLDEVKLEQPLTRETTIIEEAQPLLSAPYAALSEEKQLERIAAELRTIGKALAKYKAQHNGALPSKLSHLIAQGFLPVGGLISSADPSGGKEGGVPDAYVEWGQATEADEAGSSYQYEFSSALCQWNWRDYLSGKPADEAVDTDKNGQISWAEVKAWQMQHGDSVQAQAAAYSPSQFPLVRCYWFRYPDAYADSKIQSTVSLAVDLKTVFLSQPWWEQDAKEKQTVVLP